MNHDLRTRFDALFLKRGRERIKPGLERVRHAYELLGRPAYNTPTILIGGTNGKGSTSGFLWQLLAANRVPVGLYTSPHLIHFHERVRCSHQEVTDDDLFAIWRDIESALPTDVYAGLSFFELATLMALTQFERVGCAVNVVEVGLGGRWDATNILNPLVSVITGVSFDHREYLGDTLASIAGEKLAIARPDRPLFLGTSGEWLKDPACLDLLASAAASLHLEVYRFDEDYGWHESTAFVGGAGKKSFPIPESLPAPYLKDNLTLAAAVYECVRKRHFPQLRDVETIMPEAMRSQKAPSLLGRFTELTVTDAQGVPRPLIFDVSHNPDGLKALLAALGVKGHGQSRLPVLVSILKDKEINPMLDILRGFFGPVMLFKIPSERSISFEDLAPRHQDLRLFESFEAAWLESARTWREHQPPWVVCGSVLAVGHALEFLAVNPLAAVDKAPSSVLQPVSDNGSGANVARHSG